MQVIRFYSVSDPYGCFSNFSNHAIFLLGTRWRTVEHYFQAQKFTNDKLMNQVQMAPTPLDAARIGRDRNNSIRYDWDEVRIDVMREAVFTKFSQHRDIQNTLLSTGAALLVEHSQNDSFWADGGDGSGLNWLGKVLMDVREELRLSSKEQKNEIFPPWEKYPLLDKHALEWEMGEMSSYMSDWVLYWMTLNEFEKNTYIEKYPAPSEWKDFYDQGAGSRGNQGSRGQTP